MRTWGTTAIFPSFELHYQLSGPKFSSNSHKPMSEQTCGKGLADRSELPAKLAELIAALVENLELHQQAIDATDENGKLELYTYVTLAQEFRRIATQLQSTATHMAGSRDLPTAKHKPAKTADPKVVDAFTKFVRLEDQLIALLHLAIENDRALLSTMTGRAA
jgi:hypothetical protein